MAGESVRILGVPVDNITENEVLGFIARRIELRTPAQIVTVNAEYVMRARSDPEFRRIITDADLRTPDGAGVVLAARRRGMTPAGRVGGSDLIWSISQQAAALGHRLFLLGGQPGVAARAANVLCLRYPGLYMVGAHSGSPQSEDDDGQRALIEKAKPDILLVAFGAPAQDMWIARHKDQLGIPILMGVGGSFDYVAGTARRAPLWMQKGNLEWLFRLLREPWRWRRMLVLPAFVLLAAARSD